jgi:N-acetylneuraminic acid mutarotase
MIVWGGGDSALYNTGGRYNPATNTWSAVTTTGAPSARRFHTAIWTGSEMIVWGGLGSSPLADGARYNPIANSWTALPLGALQPRFHHTAVWTGSEMIVWGGTSGGFTKFNTGARYTPTSNTWTAVTGTGAPFARDLHTAVWTGSEMIVWGGSSGAIFGTSATNTGGRYSPALDGWTAVTLTGAPVVRFQHSAVWTGSEMIVWGGVTDGTGASFNDGMRYSPTGDSWTPLTTSNAPASRSLHTAVWTGSTMVIFGGIDSGFTLFNDVANLANVLFIFQRQ